MSEVVSKEVSILQHIPEEIQFFLNDPPLWHGESGAEYIALRAAIGASCKAGNDILKWLLVDEVTYQVWEMRRFRKIEAALVLKRQIEVVEEVFKTTLDSETRGTDIVFFARDWAHNWGRGGEAARKAEERLAACGYDVEAIHIRAYERCASELREIENAIAKRENRRRTTLLEIERRDEAFARRLAQASMEVIDGEFSEAAE